MATVVTALDLPVLDTFGLERDVASARTRQVAAQSWIAKSDLGYAVLRYDEVVAVLRERRFHNALSQIPRMNAMDDGEVGEFFGGRRRSILATEGDEHLRLRRLVSRAFTPAAADRHRPVMREVLSGLLDPLGGDGVVEAVAEICEPYPIPVICEVLGAPKEDWRLFSQWAVGIFKIFNGNLSEDLPDIKAAAEAIAAYVANLVEARRLDPRPDLLSDLIAAEEAGDRLSTDELCMLAEAVLMAGTDTTRNQLACCLAVLATRPAQWAALRADPSLLPGAVEELMRYLGAVRGTIRIASCDVEFNDVVFPQGTLVSVSLATANVDPAVFTDPEVLDVTTTRTAQQLTFGSGIHHCLGAALARAELQEALGVLTERWSAIELDGEVTWKPATFGIWGPARLPLRVTMA